jgi:hypothetical protein
MYNISKFTSWLKGLENSKPYRIMIKNGAGFYELLFWYGDYHFTEKITVKDLEDELECQKKVLNLCSLFEKNMKLKVF